MEGNRVMKGRNGQTYVVEIKCRQNHTWQGTIQWVEGKQTISFRSVLELLKLLDSAGVQCDTVDDWEEKLAL